MIQLDYSQAQTLTSEGNGDIDTAQGLQVPFVVVGIRIHYADILNGGGASIVPAAVIVGRVSIRDSDHNVELFRFPPRGIGQDANLAIDPMIYERWRFEAGDQCRIQWTTPDDGNIGFAVDIRCVPIAGANNARA